MGKASKRRYCPAIAREITSADCGENRQSHYACPESCPFNPFSPARYDEFLALEAEVDQRSMQWLIDEAREQPALQRTRAEANASSSAHALHAFYAWQLFLNHDPAGVASAGRWERAGSHGLKNDGRVLLRAKMQMRVSLLEIQQIVDGQAFEAQDLLEPGSPPIRLVDRSTAARMPRFAALLTWTYPTPHFWRISGTASDLAEIQGLEPAEIVTEVVRHLGGPADRPSQRQWLAANFTKVNDSLMAVGHERRRSMFEAMDAGIGVASYEITVRPGRALDHLDQWPHLGEGSLDEGHRQAQFTATRTWFDPQLPKGLANEQLILGQVYTGKKIWQLEAFGEDRLRRLRQQFEAHMGNRVRFTSERVERLGAQMAQAEPTPDQALIPPRLLENPMRVELVSTQLEDSFPAAETGDALASLLEARERRWLDEPLPALDSQTPRSAANHPALRPRLVQIIKQRMRGTDQRNLAEERSDDVNWLVRELGLAEIDFPPPPPRAVPPRHDEDYGDEGGLGERAEIEDQVALVGPDGLPIDLKRQAEAGRPPAPPLPTTPLTADEIAGRTEPFGGFDTAAEAIQEIAASGSAVIEQISMLTEEIFSDEEFTFLVPFMIHAWFSLVPVGVRAPALRQRAMAKSLDRRLAQIERALASPTPADFEAMMEKESLQPALMHVVTVHLVEAISKAPRKIRPEIEAVPAMMATLHTLVNELSHALRNPPADR